MTKKRLVILVMMALGILLAFWVAFWIEDKFNEMSALRTSEAVATSELVQALAERDAARAEVEYLLPANEDLQQRLNFVSDERDKWIEKNGVLIVRNNVVGNQRDQCLDREIALKMRLPVNADLRRD